jgi:hypothetical protein
MGTLNSNPTAQAAFTGQVFKKGLDLGRCKITLDDGTLVAGPTATFNAGSIVTRDNNGFIQPSIGVDTYGVAKWGKTTFGASVAVDNAIVLASTNPTPNAAFVTVNGQPRGAISDVTVRSLPNMGGVLYSGGGVDYTVTPGTGLITRNPAGAIPDGATVFVSFVYALTDADFQFDGRFFQNQDADRTAFQVDSSLRVITVITDWSRLFTTEWAPGNGIGAGNGLTYTIAGTTSKLYASTEGKFINVSGTDFVGRVFQIPTATDPFMGVISHGNPTP